MQYLHTLPVIGTEEQTIKIETSLSDFSRCKTMSQPTKWRSSSSDSEAASSYVLEDLISKAASQLGLSNLRDYQKDAFRFILEGTHDVLLAQPTGLGKSLT